MDKRWYELEERIDEFFYGSRGLETTAYADRALNTYAWDMDEIIEILKEIKEIENDLTEEQKYELRRYEQYFLEIENGENGIKEMHRQIMEIYNNIEEY